jgi:hypothetical protein
VFGIAARKSSFPKEFCANPQNLLTNRKKGINPIFDIQNNRQVPITTTRTIRIQKSDIARNVSRIYCTVEIVSD